MAFPILLKKFCLLRLSVTFVHTKFCIQSYLHLLVSRMDGCFRFPVGSLRWGIPISFEMSSSIYALSMRAHCSRHCRHISHIYERVDDALRIPITWVGSTHDYHTSVILFIIPLNWIELDKSDLSDRTHGSIKPFSMSWVPVLCTQIVIDNARFHWLARNHPLSNTSHFSSPHFYRYTSSVRNGNWFTNCTIKHNMQ